MQREPCSASAFLLLFFVAVLIALAPGAADAAKVASVIQRKAASQGPQLPAPADVSVIGTDNDSNGVDTFVVRVVDNAGSLLFSMNGQANIGETTTITLPLAQLTSCTPAAVCYIEVVDTAPGQPDVVLYRSIFISVSTSAGALTVVSINGAPTVNGQNVTINGSVVVLVAGTPVAPTLTGIAISGPGVVATSGITLGNFTVGSTTDCGPTLCTLYTATYAGTATLGAAAAQSQKLIVQAQVSLNVGGAVQTQSLSTSVPLLFGTPSCTLAANPGTVTSGQAATLTATCSATTPAQVYTWSGPGIAAPTTTAMPTFPVTPPTALGSYIYQVVPRNASGVGAAAQTTVMVVQGGTAPVCSITASPASLPAGGGSVTLTANCSGTPPLSYSWTGSNVNGQTTQTVSTTITSTQTFSVTVTNTAGSTTASVTVTVIPPLPPPGTISALSGTPQIGTPGAQLGQPFVVHVVDAQGQPVNNAQFTTTVSGGNGTLTQRTPQGTNGNYQFDFVLGSDTTTRTVSICLANNTSACATFVASTTAAFVPVIQAQAIAAITSTTQQLSNIRERLNDLRLLRNPTVTQGLKIGYDGQMLPPLSALALTPTDKDGKPVAPKGGGASADGDSFERWGVFVQGEVDIGNVDTTSTQAGFDIRTKGLTIGADYRLPGNHVLGAAFGLVKANADLDNNAGNQDTKGWSMSAFGEFVPVENAYIDLALTYGENKYDTTRRTPDPTLPTRTLEYGSNPHGRQFGASLGAGYQFYQQAWTLTPYGRVEYVDARIDSFQESGGVGSLQVSDQRYRSTVLSLGGQAQYAWNLSWGVLVPYLRAEYQYASQTSTNNITAQFVIPPTGGGNDVVGLNVPGADKNYGNVAVGATAVFPHNFSGFFNYQYLFGKEHFDDSRYTLGIRYAF